MRKPSETESCGQTKRDCPAWTAAGTSSSTAVWFRTEERSSALSAPVHTAYGETLFIFTDVLASDEATVIIAGHELNPFTRRRLTRSRAAQSDKVKTLRLSRYDAARTYLCSAAGFSDLRATDCV